jgi:hypothetical protein
MDAQLARLARTAADSGTVTVHVLTFEAGARAAAGDGSLALLEFAGPRTSGSSTWAASAAARAWKAETTSAPTRGSSTSSAPSPSARRSPPCCCAGWSAPEPAFASAISSPAALALTHSHAYLTVISRGDIGSAARSLIPLIQEFMSEHAQWRMPNVRQVAYRGRSRRDARYYRAIPASADRRAPHPLYASRAPRPDTRVRAARVHRRRAGRTTDTSAAKDS